MITKDEQIRPNQSCRSLWRNCQATAQNAARKRCKGPRMRRATLPRFFTGSVGSGRNNRKSEYTGRWSEERMSRTLSYVTCCRIGGPPFGRADKHLFIRTLPVGCACGLMHGLACLSGCGSLS